MEQNEEKLFSLEEAQRMLPDLRRRIERLRKLRRAMELNAPHIARLAERGRENAGSARGTLYLQDLLKFQQELQQFGATGCLLRDLDRGLLDIPSWRGGRKVFLCWAWGEESIDWWHETDTGFSGRRKLVD